MERNNLNPLFLFLLIVIGLQSCKKENFNNTDIEATRLGTFLDFQANDYVFGPHNATTGYKYTVLGRQYGNVFNVTNVKNAWNLISQNNISTLQPTHLYIKFTPQNLTELKAIVEGNFPMYTFPLDYEIIETGDYMRDPLTEPNQIPALYTCLPFNSNFPNATYQILDSLYLLDIRSIVAKKAFELAGELAIYPGDAEPGETIPSQLLTTTGATELHINPDYAWGPRIEPIPSDPIPPVRRQPADNITTAPSSVANVCNCSNNSDDRMPSGCIKVEETQWGNAGIAFEGVNDVKADFIGPFFQRLSPATNANGCYKSNYKIRYKILSERLPVVMSVIMISGKKVVKGLNHNGNIFEYALPMTHVIGNVALGGLSNVNVTYLRDWATTHNSTKYYTCATVNNAIYDYDRYAVQDGIYKSPNNLQVLVHKYGESAATPMFHKLLYTGSIPTATMAAFVVGTTGLLPGIGTWGLGEILVTFPPDIAYGYDYSNLQLRFSTDRIKETGYHELAHSSHYALAGNALWEQNIAYIAANGGYGTGAAAGAGRTQLIEMWGYFLGREYTHRRYGPNRHSLDDVPSFENSWYSENEEALMDHDHLPAGFLHDLIDDNAYNVSNNLLEHDLILNDSISGYTILQIFAEMNSSTTSSTQLINLLKLILPAGVSDTTYDNLASEYGY